jgi:hypothetical protein
MLPCQHKPTTASTVTMFTETSCKLLHRARSLRKLRPDTQPAPHSPPHHQHTRQMSIASDVSRASSSGSDVSHRDTSVEWDPLRLHPSMDVDRSPAVMPGPYYGHRAHHSQQAQYFPDDQAAHAPRQLASFAEHLHQADSPRADQQTFSEVYDGFDFGFADKTQHRQQSAQQTRTPQSDIDLRRPSTSGSSEPPSPVRRRPPFPGGNDELKRGDWKRRGIVFGVEIPTSEDDCFEIP